MVVVVTLYHSLIDVFHFFLLSHFALVKSKQPRSFTLIAKTVSMNSLMLLEGQLPLCSNARKATAERTLWFRNSIRLEFDRDYLRQTKALFGSNFI